MTLLNLLNPLIIANYHLLMGKHYRKLLINYKHSCTKKVRVSNRFHILRLPLVQQVRSNNDDRKKLFRFLVFHLCRNNLVSWLLGTGRETRARLQR